MTRNIAVILSANSSTFRGQMAMAGRSVDQFARQSSKAATTSARAWAAAKTAAKGALLALAAGMIAAASGAISFERRMRNVNSLLRLSDVQLQRTNQAVIDLSRRLPQSANILAEGLYDVVSSGFAGADAMRILEASATAASAGLTETAVSARAITAVINAYGLTAADAADVSDILFQTVNLGVVTFEELAGTIGDVVGTAAAASVEIDEVGAAIATMTLSGVSAAESGTSLNRLLQSLIDPSEELADALNEVGYASGVQALQVDELNVVMDKLRVASEGNIETLLAWFPEIRAARGALALMANEGENAERVFAGITDEQARAQATQRAFEEQMRATGAQLTIFANQAKATAIELGLRMLPAIQDGMQLLADGAGMAGDVLAELSARTAPGLRALGGAVENIIDVGEDLFETFEPAVRLLAGLALGGAIAAFNGLASAVEMATGFLEDHEGIVRAVVIIYAGMLATRGVRAAMMWADGVRRAAGRATDGIRNHMSNLSEFTATAGGRWNALRSVIGAAMPTIGLTAAVAVVTAAAAAFDAARAKAEALAAEVASDVRPNSLLSIRDAIVDTRIELDRQRATLAQYSDIQGVFSELVGVLTPMENKGLDAAAAVDALERSLDELEDRQASTAGAADTLGRRLGITAEEVYALADAIGVDLADAYERWVADSLITFEETAELEAQLQAVRLEAQAGSTTTDVFADALRTMADETANATDRLDAFKDSMDAIFGVHINAYEAVTNFRSAVDELVGSITDGGRTFDAFTEQGRANRDTLVSAVESAIDHADAVARETNSIEEGINVLRWHREGLLGTLQATGMTRQAAEELIDTLGLTPGNIETLVGLEGDEQAIAALDELHGDLAELDATEAHPTVVAETDEARRRIEEIRRNLQALANTGVIVSPVVPGIKRAGGGPVPGSGNGDTVPALLTPGEFVLRKSAVRAIGTGTLHALNRFAGGGLVRMQGGGSVDAAWAEYMARQQLIGNLSGTRVGQNIVGLAAGDAEAAQRELERLADAYRDVAENVSLAAANQLVWMGLSGEAFVEMAGYAVDAAAAARAVGEEHQRIHDVMFAVGDIGRSDYLAILRQRLAATERYSDDWYSIWQQINSITEEAAEEEQAILDERLEALEAHLADVEAQLADVASEVEQLYGSLAGVYESAHARFLRQQDEYADALRQRQDRIAEETRRFRDDIVATYRDVTNPVTMFGGSRTVTATEVERALRHRLTATQRFSDVFKQLVARGVSEDVLSQIAQGGPENLTLAEALLKVDPALINQSMAATGQLGGRVADIALQWERSRIEQEVYAEVALPTMRSFNELLDEELALWEANLAVQDEAEAWAQRMATEVNPQLIASYQALEAAARAAAAAAAAASSGGTATGNWGSTAGESPQARAARIAGQIVGDQRTFDQVRTSLGLSLSAGAGVDAATIAQGYDAVLGRVVQMLNRAGQYDDGGFLPPGYSIAYNGLGVPERVGGPLVNATVSIRVDGGGDSPAMIATVRQAVADGFRELRRDVERKVRR